MIKVLGKILDLLDKKERRGQIFEKDYLFASPSSAASFLQGNNVNGRILRKTITGISLSDSQ